MHGALKMKDNMKKLFKYHVKQWKIDTRFMSSITDMTANLHYKAIVAMGKDVLPLLFKELEKDTDHWFMALHELTGVNPVPDEFAGHVATMRKYWLEWARENGY